MPSYNIKLSNGSTLLDIKPLEGNGLGNTSTLLQVQDVEFKDISFGLPLGTRPDTFIVDGDVRSQYMQGTVFDISGNTGYDGTYTVNLTGFNPGDQVAAVVDGQTHIPVAAITSNVFDLVAVISSTKLKVGGVINAQNVFLPGRTITFQDNSYVPANGTSLVVLTAASSTVYEADSTNVGANTFTVLGDVRDFFTVGGLLEVTGTANGLGEGSYKVLTLALTGGNTVITLNTTYRALPSGFQTTVKPKVKPSIPVAVITTSTAAPAGVTASGSLVSQSPSTSNHALSPTVTGTTPHNYLVTWHIAGQLASQLVAGTMVQVKNARYNGARYTSTFAITTVTQVAPNVTYPQGLTEVVMALNDPAVATPIITADTNTRFVFPLVSAPFGFISYSTDNVKSTLFLVGQGAPTYNVGMTWGNALQSNMIHLTEHFSNSLPPIAPLKGQTWFDTVNSAMRVWHGVISPIIGVTPGVSGTWTIDAPAANLPAAGGVLVVYNNPGTGLITQEFTVATATQTTTPATSSGFTTAIVVTGTIPSAANAKVSSVTAAPYGNAYPKALWKDIVTTTVPTLGQIDMNNFKIINLADATNPQDAMNQRASDVRYVNVTGDTMTGTLAMSGAANITLATGNVALSGGNVTLGGAGGVTLTTGNVALNGGNVTLAGAGAVTLATGNVTLTSGNVALTSGNVTVGTGSIAVGTGTDGITIANNGAAAPTIAFNTSGSSTTTGNAVINLGNNKIINLTNPSSALDAANKAYVDSLANGILWLQPMSDPNLFHDSLTTPPVTPLVYTRTYIVPTGATGAWSTLIGRAVTWNGTTWIDVLGRAVAVGDRFGVLVNPDNDELSSLPAPGGGLTGHAGQIASVTAVGPLTYSFYTPHEPDAISVTGAPQSSGNQVNYSPHFGHSYTFRGTWGTGTYGVNYQWIEFAGPQMLVDGAGLKYTGNVLNVGQGTGIIVGADTVSIDPAYTNGAYVRLDGASPMTGLLTLSGAPTAPAHAATKAYVDGRVLDNLADVVITTPLTDNHLTYNGTNWVNVPLILDSATDVVLTAPATGQVLKFNGTNWVNAGESLDDLSDVVITAPATGQSITYNGTNWVNTVSRNATTTLASAAGVVTINYALGNYFTLSLTENVTSIVFTNLPAAGNGAQIELQIIQDATARTVTTPASFTFPGGVAYTPSTASGAVDVLKLKTFNAGTVWRVEALKAFA